MSVLGSKPENLRSSKCLPVCPPKQTSTSQSSLTFREQRSQHGAPLVGQIELQRGFALDQATDHHVLGGCVRDTGRLPIGVGGEHCGHAAAAHPFSPGLTAGSVFLVAGHACP